LVEAFLAFEQDKELVQMELMLLIVKFGVAVDELVVVVLMENLKLKIN
jgi:hypothetical protein